MARLRLIGLCLLFLFVYESALNVNGGQGQSRPRPRRPPPPPPPPAPRRVWCVVKPKNQTNDAAVAAYLDWICDIVDCAIIRKGGDCYFRNDKRKQASYLLHHSFINTRLCRDSVGTITRKNPNYGGRCPFPVAYMQGFIAD